MIATVVKIESGTEFTDKRRRIELKIIGADTFYNHVRFSETELGITGLKLDDQIEIAFGCDDAADRLRHK